MCVVSSTSDYLRVCTANAISDSNKWQVLRNFLMVAITAKHLRSSIAWVCSSFLTTSQIHWVWLHFAGPRKLDCHWMLSIWCFDSSTSGHSEASKRISMLSSDTTMLSWTIWRLGTCRRCTQQHLHFPWVIVCRRVSYLGGRFCTFHEKV